LSELPQHCQVL